MAAISRTKEYKALAERIRYGFRAGIGYGKRIQKGVEYLEAVKAGREAWDPERAKGLARISGTVYDRRRKQVGESGLTRFEELQYESAINELIEVYGTSGTREMYAGDNVPSSKEAFENIKAYRKELREEEKKVRKIIKEKMR